MVNKKLLWFNSGGFPPCFGIFSPCERVCQIRYKLFPRKLLGCTKGTALDINPYVKGCTLGASQKFSWEQLVTYLAHSKEHCKTSLAEYWGWGGGGCAVGQVTSWTTKTISVVPLFGKQLKQKKSSLQAQLHLPTLGLTWGSSTTSLFLISPWPAKASNFFVRVQLTSLLLIMPGLWGCSGPSMQVLTLCMLGP